MSISEQGLLLNISNKRKQNLASRLLHLFCVIHPLVISFMIYKHFQL